MASNQEIRVRFLAGPHFETGGALKYSCNASLITSLGMLLLSVAPAFVAAVSAAPTAPSIAKSSAAPVARIQIGREAVALLSARANDPAPDVRAAVAASWGELGNRAAIPLLKRALQDANPDVRMAAAYSLHLLGDVQGLTALIDETKALRSGPSATPADELRRMARDAARARATIKLGEVGDLGRETIRAALADPSGEVRDAAAVALGRLGLGDSAQFLAALKDTDEGVRASAAKSLGLIGRDGLDQLKKALTSDASATVRAQAATALASFKSDAESVALLVAALKEKSGRVRMAALRALAQRDEKESTAALKALLAQSPPPEPALIATAALAARGEETDLDLPELTLGQKDPELKAMAVSALASSNSPRARELLVKTMRADPDARMRVQAAAALVAGLRRPEPSR